MINKKHWPTDPRYIVYRTGRIFSTIHKRFLTGYKTPKGYIRVTLAGKQYFRGRIIASLFKRNPKNKPFVNHKNGKKDKDNVQNLEWTTTKENILHAWRTGLSKPLKGEKNGQCKITDKQIKTIRKDIFSGKYSQRQIALKHSISQQHVSQIKRKVRR